MTPADHGSDYAAMATPESTGYAKALLDAIDWLDYHGQHGAAQELMQYRNRKLVAPMLPKLSRVNPDYDKEWSHK